MESDVPNVNQPPLTWYKSIWSLEIEDMSWVEHTQLEVEFTSDVLGLTGTERVLDLACGLGRHALELARRGHSVVGVDITPVYIEEARRRAAAEELDATFVCADLRELSFCQDFDLVLNMADGAIGYLENDEENLKIFDLIAASLRTNGQHLMSVCNAEHAEMHFPKRHWDIGQHQLALPEFHWEKETRRMLYASWSLKFGEIADRPESIETHSSTRLYSIGEIESILGARGMTVMQTFGDFEGTPASHRELQLIVCSRKTTG